MPQPFQEQTYRDGTYAEARDKGYDIVQLKFDGWFDRIEIGAGLVQHYSSTGRAFGFDNLMDTEVIATLLGENMRGTQWSQQPTRLGRKYLFDCFAWEGMNLSQFTYRDRYRVLWNALERLPSTYEAVRCYPISTRDELWNIQVATGAFEGLIYRRSTDDTSGIILREKLIITDDLQCIGFEEGLGKNAGMLGCIHARTNDDVRIDVGGGFSDDQRREIYLNQTAYLNKWFEVEARARFKSGSLRHPNFIRWRFDK